MKAIIMAGGKGTRMNAKTEKPVLEIGGKTLLEKVASILKMAGLDILIAVSRHTPKTREMAERLGLDIIETPGNGYVEDVQFILEKLKLECILVISSDLPFLNKGLIQDIVKKYDEIRKPICVVTPSKDYQRFGFMASTVIVDNGEELVPVGVNIVEKEESDDYLYKIRGRVSLNVNTLKELEIVRRMIFEKKDE